MIENMPVKPQPAAPAPTTMPRDVAPAPPGDAPPEQNAKKFKFPTAFTVLAIVLVLVWIATFFVPAGRYALNGTGGPIPGTYHELANCSVTAPGAPCVNTSASFRFKQLWDATPNGLYGV